VVLVWVLSLAATATQTLAVAVSMPQTAGAPPGATTVVPVSISSAAGVLGTDIVITFDADVVTALSVSKTALSNPHTLTTNLSTPGVARISLFGATPLSGSGALLEITFRSAGPVGSQADLIFESVLLNEGQIPATPSNGHFCVQGVAGEVQALSLSHAGTGSPVAILEWDPVSFAAGYNVYRGSLSNQSDLACFLPGVSGTATLDTGAVPASGSQFIYLVTSFNCSDESTRGFASSGAERPSSNACP
jgi:hypothetical protein